MNGDAELMLVHVFQVHDITLVINGWKLYHDNRIVGDHRGGIGVSPDGSKDEFAYSEAGGLEMDDRVLLLIGDDAPAGYAIPLVVPCFKTDNRREPLDQVAPFGEEPDVVAVGGGGAGRRQIPYCIKNGQLLAEIKVGAEIF